MQKSIDPNVSLADLLTRAVVAHAARNLFTLVVINTGRQVVDSYGVTSFADIEDGSKTEALRILCIKLGINPGIFSL